MSKTHDPFADVRSATSTHRSRHGCGGYPYGNGPLLSVVAAAANARRILELGSALGYTAISLAHGAPEAVVDTVEGDPDHVRLARQNIAAKGFERRIVVHEGDFARELPSFQPGYDVAFFDGYTPTPSVLGTLRGLLRPRGVLITANMNHGGSANAVRDALLNPREWLTAFANEGETAISIKL
jgi:predicted O-methyltransferase YrrM